MSLRLIYGRAGCGKTNFCFEDIAQKINKSDKIYIITPEQFSFTAEKSLLEKLESDSVISAEVLTFNRMAYRIFNEVSGTGKANLSKTGKDMLLYSILTKNKSKLKFLGNTDENIDTISNILTDFKKHSISQTMLENTISNVEDEYLNTKLQDINLIYKKYEEHMKQNFIDEDDVLTVIAEKLVKSDMFINSTVYLDEFVGFTPQEYELIRIILKQAKEVNITVCTDEIIYNGEIEKNIFYANKFTANKLINIAKMCNIELLPSVFLEKQYRFKTEELKFLEESMYKNSYEKYKGNISNISLYLARNPYLEAEHTAKKIVELVRDYNYKYSEISVITNSLETYANSIKTIFKTYNIPVFIDEKKELNQNILVKCILSILDILSKNWSYESMFNYLKLGLLDLDIHDIYELENYCLRFGIKGEKWIKDWCYETENLERLNYIRKKVVEPIIELKEKINQLKTAKQITTQLYLFLNNNRILENFSMKIQRFKELNELEIVLEYETSLQILINLFDELVDIFGDNNISIQHYKEILKVGIKNSNLGKIPVFADQIVLGDVDRTRSHKSRAVFILGLNDGIFPGVNKNEGFLNDLDRDKLKTINIEIAKSTKERIYDDEFNIYKAFTTAEERLYLTYSSTDKEGKTLRQSTILTKIKNIFKIKEESNVISNDTMIGLKATTFNDLLIKLRNLADGEKIEEEWIYVYNWYKNNDEYKEKLKSAIKALNYTNEPEKILEKNIELLYGDILETSVSKLEQYRKCPFSFYLQYGLNLKQRPQYKLQSMDTGSLMHEVINEFFNEVKTKNIDIKQIDDSTIEITVNEIINNLMNLNRNYIFTSSAKFINLINKLRKVIIKSVKYIVYQFTISDFEVLANELEFSKSSKYPPIIINLENGKKIEVTGKIDRIDIAKGKDGEYVRIIDYKSSAKNIDLNEVIAGLQIQLLTYLDAITKIEDVLPAGVLYYNLLDPIIKNNKKMTLEELEEEIKKNFKMQGLILADVNIVKMMDKTLEVGYSKTIPAYLDKDGNISPNRSSAIPIEDFKILQKQLNSIIKKISEEILNGNINIKPYYNTKNKLKQCDICDYKSVCNFDDRKNEYCYIQYLKKDEVLNKLRNS